MASKNRFRSITKEESREAEHQIAKRNEEAYAAKAESIKKGYSGYREADKRSVNTNINTNLYATKPKKEKTRWEQYLEGLAQAQERSNSFITPAPKKTKTRAETTASLNKLRDEFSNADKENAGIYNELSRNNPAYLYANRYGETDDKGNLKTVGTGQSPVTLGAPSGLERIGRTFSGGAKDYASGVMGTVQAFAPDNMTIGQSAAWARNPNSQTYQEYERRLLNERDTRLLRNAMNLSDSASADLQRAKYGASDVGQFLVDVGSNAVKLAGDTAVNLATGGMGGMVALATRSFGSGRIEALKNGMSENKALLSGAKSAAIEVLTEKLSGAATVFAYGKGLIKNENLVKGIVNRLAKTDAGRTVLSMIFAANEEGLEEVASDLLNPIADRILQLDDGKGSIYKDTTIDQIVSDYLVGAALGLVGTGVNVANGTYTAENAQQRAYEQYQRQLVDTGLLADGEANALAQQYQPIVENSSRRGRRNLSQAETEKLQSALNGMTAENDISNIQGRIRDLGGTGDAVTAQAILKTANGEKLTKAERAAYKAFGKADMVVNEFNDTEGATANDWVYNEPASPTPNAELRQSVNNYGLTRANEVLRNGTSAARMQNKLAQNINVPLETVSRVYNLNPEVDPNAFESAFQAAYTMGQEGANEAALSNVPTLTPAQASIAYSMGRDAITENVEAPAANTAEPDSEVGNRLETEARPATVNAPAAENIQEESNEVHLRQGSKRNDSENTGRPVRELEEGAGTDTSGQTQARPEVQRGDTLKAGKEISYNGVTQKGVHRVVGSNEDTRKARSLAKARGYKVTFFKDGNIKVSKGEARALVDSENKTIYVRADHPEFTATQLMQHELTHDAIKSGEIKLDDVRATLSENFTPEQIDNMADKYAAAYTSADGKPVMSADEAFEEIVCDAMSSMNVFENTGEMPEGYQAALDTIRENTKTKGIQSRAPPKNSGAKNYSIETLPDGRKFVRADRQVIFGNDPASWSEQLENYINGKIRKGEDVKLVGADGDILTLTSESAGKISSMYTSDGRTISQSEYERKVNAGTHIDELAQVSTRGGKIVADENSRHGDMAANGWNYRTAYFQDFDRKYYRCRISVSISKNGNAIYNIGQMQERSFPAVQKALNGSSAKRGAQGKKASEDNITPSSENVNTKYSLEPVKPVEPKSDDWERSHTTEEVRKEHPQLWAVDAESSEERNPTQIKGTVRSYRKIYDYLKSQDFSGKILDASSGLGYGTRAGIDEYGFGVEDIEPFPSKEYKPKYTDYSKLNKKYDVIISNAVLNVLPQDQRDALVVKMGKMLNNGGRMFINVRGTDVRNASSKVAIDADNMEYYISESGSYQKGFTKKELVSYLKDALGSDFDVAPTTRFGKVSAVVTKLGDPNQESLFGTENVSHSEILDRAVNTYNAEHDTDVKYSLEPSAEAKENVKKAEEYFGTTYNIKEAGYICTDGKMLDFSGKKLGGPSGGRTLDHREITDAFDGDYGGDEYGGGMIQFIREGNIRVMPEMGGINLSVKPNKAQRSTLDRYISSFRGEVALDIDEPNGRTIASVEYPKYIHSSVVLKDIDDYFDKGTVPERFSLESPRLQELRRRNEQILAAATTEDTVNANERGLLDSFKKQFEKVQTLNEQLEEQRQAIEQAEASGDKSGLVAAQNREGILSNQYANARRRLNQIMSTPALETLRDRIGKQWVEQSTDTHTVSQQQAENLQAQQGREPLNLPKESMLGGLTSRHVQTLANSGVTPEGFSNALRNDAALGRFDHIKYTDDAARQRAEDKLKQVGWDRALAEFENEVAAGKTSKDITTLGITLYNNAVTKGDYATAMDIVTSLVKNATNTAQSMQAMSILNKMSPECRLYAVAKGVQDVQNELNKRYKKNNTNIEVDEQLYKDYLDALKNGDQDAANDAAAKIEQNVAQQIPATWQEKLNAWRYMAMLANPHTHFRNILGNVGFVPVRGVKNTLAYAIESAANKVTGGKVEKTQAILNLSNANDRALVTYATNNYAVVENVIMGSKWNSSFSGIDNYRTIFKAKLLEAVRKGNSKALDKEDACFCKPAYAHALAKYFKANGVTAEMLNTNQVSDELMIKAQAWAIREAQEATYRDLNWFSAAVNKIGKAQAKTFLGKLGNTLLEGMLPFKKTPANILARGVEYSPVGLIKTLTSDTIKLRKYVNGQEGGISPNDYINNLSKGLSGTMLTGLGMLLASHDVLSGGDDDDKKQDKFNDLLGRQSYSLNVGGMSITLDWLAPESMPLFVGVELYNRLAKEGTDGGKLEDVASSVMSLANPMFEMSMVQSVNDVLDDLSYIKEGNGLYRITCSLAESYISQYFPTLFGQVERTFTENQRETTYIDRNGQLGNEAQYTLGKIGNKLPIFEYNQIPYIDAWGRTESTGNVAERAFSNMVNPAYTSRIQNDAVDQELERLYKLGEDKVYPQRAEANTKIYDTPLTADQYVYYATEKGQKSREYVEGIMGSSAYKSASDSEKAYMISDAYSFADKEAKAGLGYDTRAKWQKKGEGNPVQAIIDHTLDEYPKREESTAEKQQKADDYLALIQTDEYKKKMQDAVK